MGWWDDTLGRTRVVVGDEPLDGLAEAFAAVVLQYEEEWDRKPTTAELVRLVDLVLNAASAELCSDGPFELVLSHRLTKKPARPDAAIGDYFMVPLGKALLADGLPSGEVHRHPGKF